MWTRYLVLMAPLFLCALPQRASAADRVQECIGEHVEAQVLRNQGRLTAARAHLFECSKPTCPLLVRDECIELRQAVEAALPSIILDAIDKHGRATSEPVVSVDDSPELVALDGRSVALDPGEHRLRFEHPDGEIREVKLVLAESQHDRRVLADFRAPTDGESTPRQSRLARNVMLVSAGAAAGALGAFTYFALSGRAVQNELESCKPNCENSAAVDRMRSHYLIADVSLGVALVSVGVGVYAWTQRPAGSSSARTQSATRMGLTLQPVATRRRLGLWATGEF
jgi:hypothetical protein